MLHNMIFTGSQGNLKGAYFTIILVKIIYAFLKKNCQGILLAEKKNAILICFPAVAKGPQLQDHYHHYKG